MKFLTQKKKLLSMIAMICLAAVFCVTAIAALIDMFGQFRNMFATFGFFLLSASALIGSFLGVATAACYAGAAFFQWKQGDHKKILALAGLCSLACLFVNFVYQIIFFIVFDNFQFSTLVSQFFGDVIPFLFAAYLVVFSLMKVKSPAVPIAGAVLIVLLCGSGILGVISSLISYISVFSRHFSWDFVWRIITILFQGGLDIISCAGLLLLVPLAFYSPKEEAAEEVMEEAAAEEVIEEVIAE